MPDPEARLSGATEPTEHGAEPKCNEPTWEELDRMLEELPSGIPILPPEDACNFFKYSHKPPSFADGEAAQHCADAIWRAKTASWPRGIAGLFSAVVTGFVIDSYKWLQADPNEVMVGLLAQIAQSLGPNNTMLAASSPSPSAMSRSVSTRINVFWFLSLALSLSTALFAILARQWVRELESPGVMQPLVAVGVRQLKLERHEFWKVGEIISALPLLLQLSLALFAVGILYLLWHLHPAVAVSVSIPTLLAALFYLVTTVLPTLQYSRRHYDAPLPPQCAYKSPQAMLALQAYQIAASAWRPIWTQIRCRLGVPVNQTPSVHDLEHDNILWGQIRSWSGWDEGFWNSDRYVGKETVPALYYRGFRELVLRNWDQNIRASVWSCIWEDATSRDVREITLFFPLDPVEQQNRLRCGILHMIDNSAEMPDTVSLRTCALVVLPLVMGMDPAFVAECLIQNFASLHVVAAYEIFCRAKFNFPQDPTLESLRFPENCRSEVALNLPG